MNKKIFLATLSIGVLALSGVGIASAKSLDNFPRLRENIRPHMGMKQPFKAQREEHHQALAEFLKISVEDLETRLKSGKTIEQVAKDQGVSDEQMKQFRESQKLKHLEQVKAQLEVEVKNGKITEEQKNKILEKISQHKQGPRGMGMMGPRGHKRGMMHQAVYQGENSQNG